MSPDLPFTMDFRAFDKDLRKLMLKATPDEAEKGLFRAGSEMLHDADKIPPKTPKKFGDLKGSKTVEPPKITADLIFVSAGYNIIYAARLHEMEKTPEVQEHWSEPGSGTKWLEDKMIKFKNRYMQIVANYLKSLFS